MKHHRRETDRRHPVYLITRVNYSDISQRWWNLTRPGVPKLSEIARNCKECSIISVLQSDISLKATKSHRELEPNPALRGLCAWLMKQKCG
jgi:hypothetical protein